MIDVKNLHKSFDGKQVLKGIDLTVETGKLTVVTGPNGGGKTSLAKVISGLRQATGGQILLDGEDITDKDPKDRNIGMVFQHHSGRHGAGAPP